MSGIGGGAARWWVTEAKVSEQREELPSVWRKLGRWLLDHESKLFAVFLGLLAIDQWRTLSARLSDYWIYIANGIYGSPLLSLLVTALSAVYMTVIVVILLAARRPIARYETVLPNVSAAIAGFGVYLFGVLDPAETRLLGLYAPLVLLAVGSAIVLWALVYLRRSFSVVPQARNIVESGPYGYVRHPMYVGNMLTIAGLGLLVSTPAALWLTLVCLALQLARARYEDRLLASTFVAYGAYMSRVNAFIPRLGRRRVAGLAVIIGATIVAGNVAGSMAQTTGKSREKMAETCRAWHKKALAGQWFSKKEAYEYAGTDGDQEGLGSLAACKDFFALADSCQEDVIGVIVEGTGNKNRPSAAYINANEQLLKKIEAVPACKAIAGFTYVCEGLRVLGRGGKALSSKQKSLLKECADTSIGSNTSGLMRGAL